MHNRDKRLYLSIIIGLTISVAIHIYGFIKGTPFFMDMFLFITGGIIFFSLIFYVILESIIEMFAKYKGENTKGKLIIIFIFFSAVMKTVMEIRYNR